MILLFELVKECRLSLSSLDFGTQVLSLSFQLADNVFTLLKQSLQVLDLLVFIPNLAQHLLQIILHNDARKHFIFSPAAVKRKHNGIMLGGCETEAEVNFPPGRWYKTQRKHHNYNGVV